MRWQECHKTDERLRFVARLLEGERMAELCREFDISRKIGYEIFDPTAPWAPPPSSPAPASARTPTANTPEPRSSCRPRSA